jgi:hypothetical protein
MTGYRFFTAMPANIAEALKGKVDGQATTVQATVVAQAENAGQVSAQIESVRLPS